MENSTQKEAVYTITPKGELWLKITEAIEHMLVEQKTTFLDHLMKTVGFIQIDKHSAAAMQLTSALCMVGFDGFGDTEDRR